MDKYSQQRQRLKNKATEYSDPKANRKHNKKLSSGSFEFNSLGLDHYRLPKDPSKETLGEKVFVKLGKFLKTRIGVAVTTALIVSAGFYGHDKFSEELQEDNLDTHAAAREDKKEPGQIYPDPPHPKQDTLAPAHIGLIDSYIDPDRSMAIGDSTVAWSNGTIRDNSLGSCNQEVETWPEQLGIQSLSCAGKTTRQIAKIVENNSNKLTEIDTFFITAGSNDIRGDKVVDLDRGIEKLINTITSIRPEAKIIFVSYLPAYLDKSCMNTKDRNSARRLYDFHRKANYAMQDSALRYGLGYIDIFHSPFPVCDSGKAYVRIPAHQTPGANWHTTVAGHEKVAAEIKNYIGWN